MQDVNQAPMRRKKPSRALDGRLEKRLSLYASAASAAGVGILALAPPAQAEVVFTPANIRVPQLANEEGSVKIDFNDDGVKDFSIWIWSYADFGPAYVDLFLWAKNLANGVERARPGFAARLESGATIGSSQKFVQANQLFGVPLVDMKINDTAAQTSICFGPWAKPDKDGFLGVVFDISGEKHYGWVRLTTGACIGGGRLEAIITGYAYNTEPGQPILAGEGIPEGDAMIGRPARGSLGQLALGSLGLPMWRRTPALESAENPSAR